MWNIFKKCPTHISRGAKSFSREVSSPLRPPWLLPWWRRLAGGGDARSTWTQLYLEHLSFNRALLQDGDENANWFWRVAKLVKAPTPEASAAGCSLDDCAPSFSRPSKILSKLICSIWNTIVRCRIAKKVYKMCKRVLLWNYTGQRKTDWKHCGIE